MIYREDVIYWGGFSLVFIVIMSVFVSVSILGGRVECDRIAANIESPRHQYYAIGGCWVEVDGKMVQWKNYRQVKVHSDG